MSREHLVDFLGDGEKQQGTPPPPCPMALPLHRSCAVIRLMCWWMPASMAAPRHPREQPLLSQSGGADRTDGELGALITDFT